MAGGLFLNFEGLDGCGKSTQLRRLAARLRADRYEVVETAEPGGTPIGLQIRRILLDPGNHAMSAVAEMLLYFAARAQNVDEWVRPALARGAVVLTDRFTDSTRAYQGGARNLGEALVLELEVIACRGTVPDFTVYIDVDLDVTLARTQARNKRKREEGALGDRMDEQARDFHRRVRDEYARIAAAEPDRFLVVDGRADIDTVAGRVYDAVAPRLPLLSAHASGEG